MTIDQMLELYWPYFLLLALWTVVWKGIALWKSARAGHRNWFVVLLLLNTVGLLEIFYLLFFAARTKHSTQTPSQTEERDSVTRY